MPNANRPTPQTLRPRTSKNAAGQCRTLSPRENTRRQIEIVVAGVTGIRSCQSQRNALQRALGRKQIEIGASTAREFRWACWARAQAK